MTFSMKSISGMAFLVSYFLFCEEISAVQRRCVGTSSRLSQSVDKLVNYQSLKDRYTKCTIVEGNLEIKGLPQNVDLSFLNDIEIVTGYVLIAFNEVSYIPIENLRIIRGQELFYGNDALYISGNNDQPASTTGLDRLGLKSLSEIQRGNVSVTRNDRLCYINTIDWSDMLGDDFQANINNTLQQHLQCSPCHQSCNGHCWGPSSAECQKRTKSICHQTCGKSRCSGPGPNQCCHSECASGCTGPTNADCLVCRNVNDEGRCLPACPVQKYTFDEKNSIYVEDPDSAPKYFWMGDCVEKCPERTFIQDNECVKYCRTGTHERSGQCVPCEENVCDKECFGVGNPDGPLANQNTIHANNIGHFKGCNIVRGNIVFMSYVFKGDPFYNIPPLTIEQLKESLSSIKVINGYLQIMGWHQQLHDFSVFANLTTIRGIDLFRGVVTLVVQDTASTAGPFDMAQIQSLGFRSLKSIEFGNVYIGFMNNLCYENTVNWSRILKNPIRRVNFKHGVLFRLNKQCTNETCHPACDQNGCWGPGDQDCVSCKYYSQNGRCVQQCQDGFYRSETKCLPCHSLCESCTGDGPDQCTRCKYFSFQGSCVRFQPDRRCTPSFIRRCLPCSDFLAKYKEGRDDDLFHN